VFSILAAYCVGQSIACMRLPAFLNRASLLALLCSLYNNEYASSFDFKNTSSTGFGLDMYWNDTISLANGGIAQNRRITGVLSAGVTSWYRFITGKVYSKPTILHSQVHHFIIASLHQCLVIAS
jgi:hypothetical protein